MSKKKFFSVISAACLVLVSIGVSGEGSTDNVVEQYSIDTVPIFFMPYDEDVTSGSPYDFLKSPEKVLNHLQNLSFFGLPSLRGKLDIERMAAIMFHMMGDFLLKSELEENRLRGEEYQVHASETAMKYNFSIDKLISTR